MKTSSALVQSFIARETFNGYARTQLMKLAPAAGLESDTQKMVRVLEDMIEPWGNWEIKETPHWFSDVCADGSPIEFSIALDGQEPEVRVLVEALAEEATLEAHQRSARVLTERLAREYGASIDRVKQLEDLFLPENPQGGWAMMHAVMFRRGEAPDFKVYLNPEAQGVEKAPEIMREAFRRLGFEKAWASVEKFASRGFEHDRLVYLSLDLADHEQARIKVYFRHYEATAAELDQAMSIARGHATGLAEAFSRDVSGHTGAFSSQPLVTCLSFTKCDDERPANATLYVPLWTCSANDAVTRLRIRSSLLSRGLPVAAYDSALQTMARRPLEDGNGIHTYAAFRTQNGRPRITSYWSAELYERNPAPRYQRTTPASRLHLVQP
ncbi:MAG TPA: tryptophan dimethylallyltransferase family protein [Myxococcaceae bacterium]|nr:tryptophan dimethylallyltransferase family protein [Myxococcaceae bacterium]